MTVFAIAVQPDGKILAGGAFSNIGGQTRNGIARLDAATGLADSFNPNANATVNAIAVQADGKILAGGAFTNIGGQTRNFIARLDATTGLADSFNPNADNDVVYSIAVQADGKILAGGAFTQHRRTDAQLHRPARCHDRAGRFVQPEREQLLSIQSRCRRTARSWRAAISPASADRRAITSPGSMRRPAWLIRSTRTRTVSVRAIAVQADGKILAGGNFNGANSIGGQTRNRIARLDPTTGLADSFDPNANSTVSLQSRCRRTARF